MQADRTHWVILTTSLFRLETGTPRSLFNLPKSGADLMVCALTHRAVYLVYL